MYDKCSTLKDDLGLLLSILESTNYNADRDYDPAAALVIKIVQSRGLFRERAELVGYIDDIENRAGIILKSIAPEDRHTDLADLDERYRAISQTCAALTPQTAASVVFTGPTNIHAPVVGGDVGSIAPTSLIQLSTPLDMYQYLNAEERDYVQSVNAHKKRVDRTWRAFVRTRQAGYPYDVEIIKEHGAAFDTFKQLVTDAQQLQPPTHWSALNTSWTKAMHNYRNIIVDRFSRPLFEIQDKWKKEADDSIQDMFDQIEEFIEQRKTQQGSNS